MKKEDREYWEENIKVHYDDDEYEFEDDYYND